MKTITYILMLLSFSSTLQAQDNPRILKVTNLTYPNQSFVLECEEMGCEGIVKGRINGIEKKFSMSVIDRTIDDRREYSKLEIQPYGMTRRVLNQSDRFIKEAYYAKGALSAIAALPVFAFETAITPIEELVFLSNIKKRDTLNDKSAAKRIQRNLLSDREEIIIRHKYYQEMLNYINKLPPINADEIINKLNETSKDCIVKRYGNELYLSYEFRNLQSAPDTEDGRGELALKILKYQESGICL